MFSVGQNALHALFKYRSWHLLGKELVLVMTPQNTVRITGHGYIAEILLNGVKLNKIQPMQASLLKHSVQLSDHLFYQHEGGIKFFRHFR